MIQQQSSLKVADIKCDHIVPNPNNANEMDDVSFSRLVDEIRDIGFLVPIHVVPSGDQFKILNGEHRWKAAKELNYEYIPAVIHQDEKFNDQDIFELVNVRINSIRGKTNTNKFFPLWNRVVEKYGLDEAQKVFAIDTQAWKKINKAMVKNLQKLNLPTSIQVAINEQANRDDISPDKLAKKLTKVLSSSHIHNNTNCMVLTNKGVDSLIVHLTPENHSAMKRIIDYCQINGLDINDYIGTIVLGVSSSLRSDNKVDLGE